MQLSLALQAMREAVRAGERDIAGIERRATDALAARGWAPDYLTLRRRPVD